MSDRSVRYYVDGRSPGYEWSNLAGPFTSIADAQRALADVKKDEADRLEDTYRTRDQVSRQYGVSFDRGEHLAAMHRVRESFQHRIRQERGPEGSMEWMPPESR
jgi:hypothetical protein